MYSAEIDAFCGARMRAYQDELKLLAKRKLDRTNLRVNDAAYKERRKARNPEQYRSIRCKESAKHRAKKGKPTDFVATLDFETDRFDADNPDLLVQPFTCDIYSPHFGHNVFWNNDSDALIDEIIVFLESLPNKYVIYAHNGGRFDYHFFLKYIRGEVMLIGTTIVDARLCGHTLRDSYKLIPAPLAAIKKDDFDYNKLHKTRRDKHRDEIIQYMKNDCEYLYRNVDAFLKEEGFVLTVGQAAIRSCKKTSKFEPLSEERDAQLREYFIGGRTECIRGAGMFKCAESDEPYKTYDINSSYPAAMAFAQHPVEAIPFIRSSGEPTDHTFFLKIRCKNDRALLAYKDDGSLTSRVKEGVFLTTIHEYNMALKHKRIKDIEFLQLFDYETSQNFAAFIMPLYAEREQLKIHLLAFPDDEEARRRSLFLKLKMNNAYGKYAQDARRFKATWLSDAGERPSDNEGQGQGSWGDVGGGLCAPSEQGETTWTWTRPNPGMRFNSVSTAASITGAARAQLMDGIFKAVEPIYCDTDSITCKALPGVILDDSKLGAWGLEATFNQVAIAGKKMYACRTVIGGIEQGKAKIRHKGISRKRGLTWNNFADMVERDAVIPTINFAPTFSLDGSQDYKRRNVRCTEELYQPGITPQPFQS